MPCHRTADVGIANARIVAFRSDDLDHVRHFVTANFADHSRVVRRRGPLGFRIAAATSGACASGTTSCALPSVVRATPRTLVVHLPQGPGAEYRVGRRAYQSAQDRAVLLCPGHDYTVSSPPGATLALFVDPALVEREIEALGLRRRGGWTLRSADVPLAPASIATMRAIVRRHGAAVSRAPLTDGIDALREIEAETATWVAQLVASGKSHVPLPATHRQVVQHVDDWIRRNLSQPITLEKLQTASGLSARALQEACLARWGRTPIELVATRRLELARTLLEGGKARSVTDAAVCSGFSHLGRFSVAYRRTFGESPSDTLAKQ